MAGSPQHATLVADTVTTMTFDQDFTRIEVVNVDGAAPVYFRIGTTSPTVEGIGSHVLPAAICSVEVDVFTADATVVKLISTGTPKVSVRGL
jgi:hypothetical protein